MTDFLDRISALSPKRLALLALEQHEQLEAARSPIAVVGIGCRFPGGADDPAKYWQLLREGRDATREVPRDRWDIDAYYNPDPDEPGSIAVRSGGFLDRVDGFDPEFFGISPREARTMDPQQRLTLEVVWEALEHAGIAPESLAGSASGVWMGVCNSDHFLRVIQHGGEAVDMYLASGNAPSVVAGRVAYLLGLRGPALSIDTACSSSLVALQAAVRALRQGDVRLAIAGGVNVMCAPETMIALSRAHMLAPDGRCKTFDASADGFARGEGCGIVVLKRLADAQDDGDRVIAVIRGAAANQDGRSSGLTVPNGPAQEAVIRAALADAGLEPSDVDYVEAHGTGTSLGDPIEIRALGAAYGQGRDVTSPLVVGSAKTNFGHLESAAGIAGTIKTILALHHEWIPRHLHFSTPSPHIPWSSLPVVVADQGREWTRGPRPRRAGVSSFGFSGTNAHLIIEEAPLADTSHADADRRPAFCLPLSARTSSALTALAPQWATALRADSARSLADAVHTAGAGRSHLAERVAIVASTLSEAADALDAFAAGVEHPNVRRGRATPGTPTDVVFLFTGQGAQYPGLATALYDASPVVRSVIDKCDALLGPDKDGLRLLDVLRDTRESSPIHETRWTQPATFAVQMALVELWRSWGVSPAGVLGHSAGEYAAACAAGVFSLEDGLALIAERGRVMQALGPGGAMAAINARTSVVEQAIAAFDGRVTIAAYNADDAVVISGVDALVDDACASLTAQGVECHRLWVPLASHSPLMDAGLDEMEAAAARATMHAPQIPVAWNLTGGAALPGGAPTPNYWRRHLREPVRFAEGMRTLWKDGFRTFVEIGPHPVLVALAQRALGEPADFAGVPSLRRNKDEWRELTSALAELYVRGAAVDWNGVTQRGAERPAMPTYPFERRSFWIEAGAPGVQRGLATRRANSLLGLRALPTAVPLFETTLIPSSPAWLAEHRVHGVAIAAGPVFLELAFEAARLTKHSAQGVDAFVIHAPLVVRDAGTRVQVELGPESEGAIAVRIHALPIAPDGDAAEWQLCATARLTLTASSRHEPNAPLNDVARALGELEPTDSFYARLLALGVALGPSFRGLRQAHRRDGETLARIELPTALASEAVTWAHPALLDAALQALGLTLPESADTRDTYLLTGIEHAELLGALPNALWCHARLAPASGPRPAEWLGDITLLSDDGRVLGAFRGVTMRRVSRDALARAAGTATDDGLYYAVAWEPAPLAVTEHADDSTTAPSVLAKAADERYRALAAENDLASYDALLPALDSIVTDQVRDAMRDLGFVDAVNRRLNARSEARALGVQPRHSRLFARLLDLLVQAGDLRRDGDTFVVARELPLDTGMNPIASLPAALVAESPELALLSRCGPQLAEVLRGTVDPLGLIFPGGELAEARRLYEDSPSARVTNGTLAGLVADFVAAYPASTGIRVLEIGGGTGGTTGSLLGVLPADRTTYTFSDVSPLFLERARIRFAHAPFVSPRLLDIEKDPASQGFTAGTYEIVVAANVLHAAADLPRALEHARSLLVPGGVLLLVEGTTPEPWVDLTFGMTEGWWRFTDGARTDYPLLARDAWRELLAASGFDDPQLVPREASASRGAQQTVIVARAPITATVKRRWTLVADRGGVVSALAALLVSRGDDVILRDPLDSPDSIDGNLVYLAGLDAVDAATAESLAGIRALAWLRASIGASMNDRAWLVTAGAQPAMDREGEAGRWQSPLWGMGRVFALEQPGRWGGLIDLAPNTPASQAADELLASLLASDDEDQIAWRDGQRFAARLAHVASPAPAPLSVRSDVSYLITGGFGGLGLVVARWLAEHGARTIALLGRHPDLETEAVREIEAAGARVVALSGDVADADAMSKHFARFGADLPALGGVVHAAAAFSAAPIATLADSDVAAMLRPKLHGTMVLEQLSAAHQPDWTVYFSSTTALLGASGFAHYAAANAFLDSSARAARRNRRNVTSVNWGTWEVMRLASASSQQSYRESGLEPLSATEACEAMGRIIAAGAPEMVVARVDWQTLKPLHEARRRRPFLQHVGLAPALRVPETAPTERGSQTLVDRLAKVAGPARRDALLEFVSGEVAVVLGLDPGLPVATDLGLFEMGMDSLMSVELRKRLERAAGIPLPSTLTFNYPNVGSLTTFLDGELGNQAPPAVVALEAPVVQPTVITSDVASLSDEELEARLLARLEALR